CPGAVHGPQAGGARPELFVVVATTTTQECRRCHSDDKPSRGTAVPPVTPAAWVTAVTLSPGAGAAAPGAGARGQRDAHRPCPVRPAPGGGTFLARLRRAGSQFRGEHRV